VEPHEAYDSAAFSFRRAPCCRAHAVIISVGSHAPILGFVLLERGELDVEDVGDVDEVSGRRSRG